MISSWMKKRAARREKKNRDRTGLNVDEMELIIPNHFRCPISLDLIKDPVTLSTGITYDRDSIEKWVEFGQLSCPVTNQVLSNFEPVPNHTIRKMIQDWCVDNKSYGIERIPTPRIPITSSEVLEYQSKITTASLNHDGVGCKDLVVKIKTLSKESERNKKCIVANGTNRVLAVAFDGFSKGLSFDENVVVLEEILSTMISLSHLDGEARTRLGSTSSMACLVWFLKSGDLTRRGNAVIALKEVVTSDEKKIDALTNIDGSMEALFKLINQPICPTPTKASLMIIYNMITTKPERTVTRLIDMGLISILVEMSVDADRSVCEKALAILDGVCDDEHGREMVYREALTVPVLVKKILRVSDLATEFSVSVLWKLSKNYCSDNGGGCSENVVAVEALEVGGFQKLLLVLQVGCGSDGTKVKVSELLKMMNLHRGKVECIDSMDFKDLKRPF